MIIVTTPEVPNKKIIKVHGIARGVLLELEMLAEILSQELKI